MAVARAPFEQSRSKAVTLDGLRGIAALGVVVFHASAFGSELGITIPLSEVGETGVQLFFVLSGYLITTAVLSSAYTPRSFIVNRTLRILPAYYFSIVASVLLVGAGVLSTRDGIQNLASHAVLVQDLFRDYRTSINPVLWTLSIEWMFYVFMLVCARGLRNQKASWCIVGGMVVFALLYRAWMWNTWPDQGAQLNYMYKHLPGMADEFAYGMAAALAMRRPGFRRFVARPIVRSTGLAASVAAFVGAAVVFLRHDPGDEVYGYWHQWYMVVLWPVAFCAAVAGVVVFLQQFEARFAPWIRRSGLGFVGLCSYSLYLFHPIVISAFARGWDQRRATVSPSVYFIFLLLGTLAVAATVYYLVERPFMEMRSRFTAPRAVTAPPPAPTILEPVRPPVSVG